MTDLSELRERLEKAKGPSEKLDHAIYLALRYPDKADPLRAQADIYMGPYTSSLDAAVALVERVLPGWRIELREHHHPALRRHGAWYCCLWHPARELMNDLRDERKGKCQHCDTPALALCLALTRAMEADDADA